LHLYHIQVLTSTHQKTWQVRTPNVNLYSSKKAKIIEILLKGVLFKEPGRMLGVL